MTSSYDNMMDQPTSKDPLAHHPDRRDDLIRAIRNLAGAQRVDVAARMPSDVLDELVYLGRAAEDARHSCGDQDRGEQAAGVV